MSEQEQLHQAIASLEEQRLALGSSVVDTTIAALQEKLSLLDEATHHNHAPKTAQRKQVTILFATITGMASVAESLPDTNFLRHDEWAVAAAGSRYHAARWHD